MISIIIPACNEEKYIKNTINSVKQQNFKDYEIIVVCDGCTDKTSKITKRLTRKTIILNQRSGPAVAKNEGAKLAKYDKFVFLDADTLLTENSLQSMSDAIDNKLYGTCKIKPSSNKLKHKFMMFLKNFCPLPFTNGIIFCHRDNFNKINGFPSLKKGEDGKFVRKLSKYAKFTVLDNYVISSTRRFDNKGYLSVGIYWIKEYFKPSNEDYEVIR